MSESKVNPENYIVIQGWMVRELELKGNELLLYAIIYGFSQTDNQVFSGSVQYLADWTNSSKQSVVKCLKSLVEKHLVMKNEKYINGVKFCEYYATKFNGVCNKVEWGMQQSLIGGMQQSLPNNIGEYKSIDNPNKNDRKATSRFKPPTLEEVKAYCIERQNNVNAERFIDYYTANGWKVGKNSMKDWKAAVRTWEKNSYNSGTQYQASQPVPEPDNFW